LSNREYEVFLRLGAGKAADQIAEELKLSPKTVRTYRSRILEKTSLRSTAEIIFYAVNHELVTEVAKARDKEDEEEDAPVQRPGSRRRTPRS
jgi:DNA-binding CsgD family transcriptional regulator